MFFTGAQWELTLADTTTGAGFSVSQPCPPGSTCRNRNAEVISEAPDGGPPNASLADYGIVGFTHVAITDTAGHRYTIDP